MKKYFLTIALLTILSGCGVGGNSSQNSTPQNPTPPTKPSNCPQENFVDAIPNQPITDSSCSNQSGNITTITFSSDTNNLYAELKMSSPYLFSYNFYLAYDQTALEFIEYQHGNFQGMSGNTANLMIKETAPNEGAAASVFTSCDVQSGKKVLIFSHSLIGYSNGSLPGNIILGTLRFRKLKPISQTELIFKEIKTFEKYSNASITDTPVCWPQKIRLTNY